MSAGVATPPVARRSRSVLGWAAVTAGLLVAGIAVAAIAGINTMPAQGLLDPEAAGPEGSRALAELLRDRGVEVEIARDRTAALQALEGGDATLAIADTAPLDDDDLRELRDAASGVVLLEPRTRDLRVLLGDPRSAGFGDGSAAAPSCDLPAAAVSGPVRPGEVFSGEGQTAPVTRPATATASSSRTAAPTPSSLWTRPRCWSTNGSPKRATPRSA